MISHALVQQVGLMISARLVSVSPRVFTASPGIRIWRGPSAPKSRAHTARPSQGWRRQVPVQPLYRDRRPLLHESTLRSCQVDPTYVASNRVEASMRPRLPHRRSKGGGFGSSALASRRSARPASRPAAISSARSAAARLANHDPFEFGPPGEAIPDTDRACLPAGGSDS
jgi:hypothetical protein